MTSGSSLKFVTLFFFAVANYIVLQLSLRNLQYLLLTVYSCRFVIVLLFCVSAGTPRIQASLGQAAEGSKHDAAQSGRRSYRQQAAASIDRRSQGQMPDRVLIVAMPK